MNGTIAVIGSGSVAGPPDIAVVSIGVEVLGRSVAAARSEAATGIAGVIASLKASGLTDADIATTSYSINPEYDHREGRRLRGYRVSNTVEAQVGNLEDLGSIIDSAAEAGSDHTVINSLRFLHSDDRSLATVAREAAFADARAKAIELADLAGVGLGPVVSVVEQDHHRIAPSPVRGMKMEAAVATSIESGELGVDVTLQVEFGIGPKWA